MALCNYCALKSIKSLAEETYKVVHIHMTKAGSARVFILGPEELLGKRTRRQYNYWFARLTDHCVCQGENDVLYKKRRKCSSNLSNAK